MASDVMGWTRLCISVGLLGNTFGWRVSQMKAWTSLCIGVYDYIVHRFWRSGIRR